MPAPPTSSRTAPGDSAALLAAIGAGRVPIPTQPGPGRGEAPRPVHPVRVAAVLLAAGLLLATAVSQARRSAPDVDRQRSALQAQIATRTREVDGLAAARRRLAAQLAGGRTAAARATAAAAAAAATTARLAPITGAAAVRGPGLTVRLADPTAGTGRRITDSDVASVANALWAAGAEAVAVNGVRLTSRTAIRTAGDAILVGFRPQSSPYVVAAVGPPEELRRGFAASDAASRLRAAVDGFGIGLSSATAGALLLPAARSLAGPDAGGAAP